MLGPSMVLLFSYNLNSSLINFCNTSNENDLEVGSLASVTPRLGQGQVMGLLSGVVGTYQGLLVSLLNSPAVQFVNESSMEWLFEGGQCWFELQEVGFIQFSVVRCHNIEYINYRHMSLP